MNILILILQLLFIYSFIRQINYYIYMNYDQCLQDFLYDWLFSWSSIVLFFMSSRNIIIFCFILLLSYILLSIIHSMNYIKDYISFINVILLYSLRLDMLFLRFNTFRMNYFIMFFNFNSIYASILLFNYSFQFRIFIKVLVFQFLLWI